MYETQKSDLSHITSITPYSTGQYMVLDASPGGTWNFWRTLREKQKRGTLLWVLDKTRTAMGARLLRSFIEQPLIRKEAILDRQNGVEELNLNYISREEIREYLNSIYDLERLIGRISYKTAQRQGPPVLQEFPGHAALHPGPPEGVYLPGAGADL